MGATIGLGEFEGSSNSPRESYIYEYVSIGNDIICKFCKLV